MTSTTPSKGGSKHAQTNGLKTDDEKSKKSFGLKSGK